MELKESHLDLIDYLKSHELDIYDSINDLGYLATVFLEVFGHPAGIAISDKTKKAHRYNEDRTDTTLSGRIGRNTRRLDKLEAFTEAMLGIFPELDVEYQNIYNPPPKTLMGNSNE